MVTKYQPKRRTEPFTEEEVQTAITELRKKKASGQDNIYTCWNYLELYHNFFDVSSTFDNLYVGLHYSKDCATFSAPSYCTRASQATVKIGTQQCSASEKNFRKDLSEDVPKDQTSNENITVAIPYAEELHGNDRGNLPYKYWSESCKRRAIPEEMV